MLIVALTGGIGSGKSTVGEIFVQLGALVVDSDQIARDVLVRGSEGFDHVVAEFGDKTLRNGDIDRALLGDIVFNDREKLAKLESITHPLIRKAFKNFVNQAPADSIVINQIPLLIESKSNYNFDVVITVSAPEEVRRQRLRIRGLSESEINGRMAAQASDSEREAISNFVIQNSADQDELTSSVEKIWAKLQILNNGKQ
jgi:dephospho-CoA kinase